MRLLEVVNSRQFPPARAIWAQSTRTHGLVSTRVLIELKPNFPGISGYGLRAEKCVGANFFEPNAVRLPAPRRYKKGAKIKFENEQKDPLSRRPSWCNPSSIRIF
jgi:hypothetical protein